MQSLGDSTLAAFVQSDLSTAFGNAITTKSIAEATKSTKNKDESDIAKYFKDSLVFLSKDSDKENNRPSTIPQFVGNISEISNRETARLQVDIGTRSVATKYVARKEKSQTRTTKEFSIKSNDDLGALRVSNTSDKRINYSKNDTAVATKENSLLSRSEQKSSHQTTTNSTIEIPSAICTLDRCKLVSWGLPLEILRKYEERGLTSMFPWQVECLSNRELLEKNRNLVYSAPTSAGKTLVAEILIIKTVTERRKKVIFILPFVSVVREKMYYFQDLLSSSGLRVEGFMGGCAPAGGFAATDVAIATIEKANSLLNQLMEEGNLVNLGAVVIDELHLLGDPHRGYLLELLLTKLKYMTLRDELVHVQLIGMSATLPNLALLAKWLDAELYKTDFRPVPLNELCKIDATIYDNEMNKVRILPSIPELSVDSDNILQLCLETISHGHSVLIFCPTKNWCEKLAHQVSMTFSKLGRENTLIGDTLRKQLNTEAIMETLEQLKRSPAGLDEILRGTVSFAAAFHHAGLTMDERDVIEGAFRSGALRVLTATSTLSSGVNLPARRVIIRSLMFHGKPLDTLTYRQMIGRAGRMGKDTAGESILVCKTNETRAASTLLSSNLPPIDSCLEGSKPLIRALLEAVASEVAYTANDIKLYTRCTLASVTNEDFIEESTKEAIKFLVDNELFMLQTTKEGDERWIATPLGKACLAASIAPADGLFLFEELQKARRCFVLDTELHVIYLVTPLNSSQLIGQIDWFVFLDLWKSITESERRVGQLVGVDENFLVAGIRGTSRTGKILDVHKRFYTALALHELVREVPLIQVCRKYGCCRGVIQNLQQSAATFAGMVTQFCKKLGWSCMELLIGQFQARLQFGVCRELLDLLRLPMLNGLRARSLYKEGITCVAELAVANELDVERALHKALPFESGKEFDGEHEVEAARRNKMRSVFVTGRDGLTPQEAAAILVREARTLVQNELGLDEVQWNNKRDLSTGMDNRSKSSRENSNLVEQFSTLNGQSKIDVSAKVVRGNSIEEIVTKIDDNRENEAKSIIMESGPSEQIAEIHSESHQPVAQMTHSNQLSSADINIDLVCNADIRFEDSFQFTNTRNKNRTIEEAIGSKTPKGISNDDIVHSVCTGSEINPNEIATKRLTGEEICEDDIFDFTNTGNAINTGKNVTRRNIQDEITKNNPSKIGDNRNVIHPKEDAFESKSHETMCKEDVFVFTGTASRMDLEEKLLGLKNKTLAKSPAILLRESFVNEPDSRSPSLFGDSMTVDSQEFNILEQNVIDSLNISDFSENNKSGFVNTPKNRMSDGKKTDRCSSTASQRRLSLKNTGTRRSPRILELKNRSKSLAWDDSWNKTNGFIETVNMLNTAVTLRDFKTPQRSKIVEENEKISSRILKACGDDRLTPKNRTTELQKIPQKRKLTEPSLDKSSTSGLLKFAATRKLSVDSNKSDSDDLVLSSQKTALSSNVMKSRTRFKQSLLRESSTQRSTNKAHLRDKQVEENLRINDVLCNNRSIEIVVSSSDEETPVKRTNPLTKSKKISPVGKPSVHRKEVLGAVNKIAVDDTRKKASKSLQVVSVTVNWARFNQFKRDLQKREDISLALAGETFLNGTTSIGTKIIGITDIDGRKKTKKIENCAYGNKKIYGIAVSWDGNVVYYISFDNSHESKVPVRERLDLITEMLNRPDLTVRCFSSKEIYKILYNSCGITSSCQFLDPKTADWLLDPDRSERNFNALIADYLTEAQSMVQHSGSHIGRAGPGLNVKSVTSSGIYATTEAALTWHLTNSLTTKLEARSSMLLQTFKEIEMKTLMLLARMELTGLGVNLKSLQELSDVIQQEMSQLENKAYTLAGKTFNFSSSKSVAQILGLYKGKKACTKKSALEHCENPISRLVMFWRKLSTTQTKVIFPLLRLAESNSRIHGNCVTNTATGRVSMFEPNLQNVPRDFNSQDDSFVISVRMAFVPKPGNIMLSADYCQLELRILAHFSKETNLCKILRKEGDVFRNIAARWYNIAEDNVDDGMRQRTKQLCYGMIYGMGVKTLAETLSVTEMEAKEFLETFMGAYPGIRPWLDQVVEDARTNGYVTTLMERRRYLPALHSEITSERAQAERQAVNTKVQASAADIAKKAMVKIDERMRYEFPNAPLVLTDIPMRRKLRSCSREDVPRGGYLILQIHDELLYEANAADLDKVGRIIKESMEESCQLRVPLPVKLKVGSAWGDLAEHRLEIL